MDNKRATKLMRSFWDDKAQENAMYYISSFRAYDEQDPEEFWKWGKILAERFLKESEIPFTGEESALEIGCGIGRMTVYFAERFARVTGIDVSPEMIDRARENLSAVDNASVRTGNGFDLGDFDDNTFDFAFSYITFQHIPDASITLNYIREAGRVLRQGGYFYFQVNNMPVGMRGRLNLKSRVKSLMSRFGIGSHPDSAGRGPRDLDNPAWQGSRLTLRQTTDACHAGGMEVLGLDGEGTQYLWVKATKK